MAFHRQFHWKLSEWISFSFASFLDTHDHWFFLWSTLRKQINWKYPYSLIITSQLIHFNTICQRGNSRNSRHISAQETPLSTYVVFLLYSHTRSRLLMDKFYDLGLFISYDWMLFLSTQLGNSIFTQFESDGAVCPTKLRSNAFTTFGQNSSSLSAKDSWH